MGIHKEKVEGEEVATNILAKVNLARK